jgi:eukaryotic-like serine/threonine-protein kinase
VLALHLRAGQSSAGPVGTARVRTFSDHNLHERGREQFTLQFNGDTLRPFTDAIGGVIDLMTFVAVAVWIACPRVARTVSRGMMSAMSDPVDRLRLALAGRYGIDRELGRGGMATVYLAKDIRHGRMVALKILDGRVAEADRFVHEIKTAAQLTHPHILPVHDSGNANGVLFYVMPFVEGESLRDRLRREKQLPVPDAIRIIREVAQALDYAHRHDVVHRDIKPENILLQDGHAVIADFGIAGAIAGQAGGLTQTGLVVGTPACMSPEQGLGQPVDGRSDLYSLGCVFYEILAGVPPFAHSTAQVLFSQRLNAQAPRVSALRPTVSPAVDQALATALQVAPADRFQTLGDFAAALHGEADQNTPSSNRSPLPTSVHGLRQLRGLWAIGIALFALVAIATVLYLARAKPQSPARNGTPPAAAGSTPPSIAVLPFVNVSADASNEYFADGMTEELINALSRLAGPRVTSRTSAFSFKKTSTNVRDIAAKLGVAWVLEGSVRKADNRLRITAQLIDVRNDSQEWSNTYERQLDDVFAIQDEIARAIVTALSVRLTANPSQTLVAVPTGNLAAYQLYLQGRYFWNKRDEASLLKAIEYFNQALAIDSNYALAHAGLADAHVILGGNGHRRPSEVYPKAKASIRRALELDASLSQPHATLGLVLTQYDWDFEGALEQYQLAAQVNPNYSTVPHWRAWTLVALGRLEEALSEMRRAQALDPLSLTINAQIGTMLHYLRRYDDADRAYRGELEIDPGFAMAHAYLAANHARRGQFELALSEGRLASAQFGKESSIRTLAPIHAAVGQRKEAEAALTALGALSARAYVSELDFAAVHALLGNRDEAFVWLERAVTARASDLFTIRVDPMWDSIRDDQRFDEVLRKMRPEQ